MKKMLVTIPAHNEDKTVGKLVDGVRDIVSNISSSYDILVIDDGSTDDTYAAAKNAGARVLHLPIRCGLAEVFQIGLGEVRKTEPELIIHIDADYQYRPAEIPLLIDPILKGEADIVLGSRFAGTIECMPAVKRLGNMFLTRIVSRMIGISLTDAQTGFRAFTPAAADKIRIISRYTYTQEMIIRAARANLKIVEVPVYFAKRMEGEAKISKSYLKYGLLVGIDLLRVWKSR